MVVTYLVEILSDSFIEIAFDVLLYFILGWLEVLEEMIGKEHCYLFHMSEELIEVQGLYF